MKLANLTKVLAATFVLVGLLATSSASVSATEDGVISQSIEQEQEASSDGVEQTIIEDQTCLKPDDVDVLVCDEDTVNTVNSPED
jgi:hypothetical protein